MGAYRDYSTPVSLSILACLKKTHILRRAILPVIALAMSLRGGIAAVAISGLYQS
jgi:hypothetical protein